MSKRVISMTLAALATSLTVGAASVEAANKPLTEQQIRGIVKQEVAKVRQGPAGRPGTAGRAGAAGARGARGPAGMDGFPSLFADVDIGGFVDAAVSAGINQENVRRVELDAGANEFDYEYCFSGLPPVNGGQVTLSGPAVGGVVMVPYLQVTDDPMCSPRVFISDTVNQGGVAASFHILLY